MLIIVVDGNWEEWGQWNGCSSQTCGDLNQTRSRDCVEEQHGGVQICPLGQTENEVEECGLTPCPGWSTSFFFSVFIIMFDPINFGILKFMVDGVCGQTGAHVPGFTSVNMHLSQELVYVTLPALTMVVMTVRLYQLKPQRNPSFV